VRALRDVIAFCPPLIIDRQQIDMMFDGVEKALDAMAPSMQAN
jgi:adenosylmethionine-8-amino-7-oxononanoate aminotransferase